MADTGGVQLDRYDFDSHYVNLPEGRIHYIDVGTGPALLMVHGNPTWSYLYRHMIHGLKDKFRCVAVDHLGFGLSDKPSDGDYTVAAHSRRLGEVIEKIGLEKLTPVVQDWGGPIGLNWAVHHKSRVERLVIMNTIGFVPARADLELSKVWALGVLGSLKTPGLGELLIRLLESVCAPRHVRGDLQQAEQDPRATQGLLHRASRLCLARGYPEISARDTPESLPSQHQTSARHRRRAARLGRSHPARLGLARHFEKLLPSHQPTVEIPNASHFLQEDTPEPIIAAIRQFYGV